MLQKNNGSYQNEINSFFDYLGLSAASFPTASALCQSRGKLSPKAFIELNDLSVDTFYTEVGYRTWKGHRVLGNDGSTLQLPKHESTEEEFGVHKFGPQAKSSQSLARISYLYDVLNGLVVDAQMKGFSVSEADLAWEHLRCIKKNDIVIYDRYYASLPLMFKLKSMGGHFCFRMKTGWWTKVRDFVQSKSNDKIVCFKLPKKYTVWAEKENMPKVIKCRLLKRKNKKGEVEVFCTSLLDKKKYSKSAICNLYKERWNVEEGYKLIKARLEVEDFSGVKSIVVKQDFYAKTLLLTLNAILCHKIKPSKKCVAKRVINVNKAIGLATTKRLFLKLASSWKVAEVVKYYTEIISDQFNFSRKGQHAPRNKKIHPKFSMSYKTT